MQNIISQTYRHIGLNQKLINQELRELNVHEYIQIKPLIVMPNDNVMIIIESDVPLVRISNIYHHITQFAKELDADIFSSIEKIVKDNTLSPIQHDSLPAFL